MSTSSAVPVGQPLHGASFGQAVRRFFAGYARFSGRASRSEFWWAYLFVTVVSIVASVPYWIVWGILMARTITGAGDRSTTDPQLMADAVSLTVWLLVCGGILLLVSLALLLPTLSVMWRRLQDANFHGAIALVTVVGFGIVPFIMCFFPSNPAGVQYDPQYRAQLATAYGQVGAAGYGLDGYAPGYAQPGYVPDGYAQPGYVPDGYAQPGYVPDGYAQPGSAQLVDGQPAYGQPAHGQLPYGQPAHGRPAYGQPAYGQPAYDQSPYDQPDPVSPAPAESGPAYGEPFTQPPGAAPQPPTGA